MLVLSRRIGEEICIGDGVVLTVVAVQRSRVRLGIQAPPNVKVDRHEVRRWTVTEHSAAERDELVPLLAGHT